MTPQLGCPKLKVGATKSDKSRIVTGVWRMVPRRSENIAIAPCVDDGLIMFCLKGTRKKCHRPMSSHSGISDIGRGHDHAQLHVLCQTTTTHRHRELDGALRVLGAVHEGVVDPKQDEC